MQRLLAVAVSVFVSPAFAGAQDPGHFSSWQSYLLVGTGWASESYGPSNPFAPQIAAGGEVVSILGIGVGFEAGWTRFSNYRPWLKTPSLEFSYHVPKLAHKRIEPFVQAGGTLMFEYTSPSRGGMAANVAGGINYWFSRHVALRCDFKDIAQPSYYHYLGYPSPREFRVGVTFR